MFDDVHARGGLHRRHKRGYIPATLYTDFGSFTQESSASVTTPTPGQYAAKRDVDGVALGVGSPRGGRCCALHAEHIVLQ